MKTGCVSTVWKELFSCSHIAIQVSFYQVKFTGWLPSELSLYQDEELQYTNLLLIYLLFGFRILIDHRAAGGHADISSPAVRVKGANQVSEKPAWRETTMNPLAWWWIGWLSWKISIKVVNAFAQAVNWVSLFLIIVLKQYGHNHYKDNHKVAFFKKNVN